jgi:hypothetical protein
VRPGRDRPARSRCPSLKDLNLPDKVGIDPWDTPLRTECSDDGFAARSAGPDRVFGTDDDLPGSKP